MEGESTIGCEERWLRDAAALRTLAANLVGRGPDADDLAQEAWLRLARGSPARHSWLRAVVRNLARDRARESARRGWTERAVARAERVPSGDEIAARLEIAQRLAAEVARLEEPYRTAIHLRYFEGLSPPDIARRGGWPLESVRTRLKRGLALLRERLDRASSGDRERWMLALAPLARRAPIPVAAARPVFAGIAGAWMSTKIWIACASAVAVALGVCLWHRNDGAASAGPREGGARAVPTANTAGAIRESDVARAEVAASDASIDAPTASAADEVEVRGTVVVVDAEGGEHRGVSGTLRIGYGTGPRDFQPREIAVARGQWSTRLPPGSTLAIGELIAESRPVALDGSSPMLAGGGPIEVRGRWLAQGRLRVVDARTGQDLSGVEVRCSHRGWRATPEWSHPGDHPAIETVLTGAVSPLDLPESRAYTAYWVRAPGYAWGRVVFDRRTTTEQTIALDLSAAVDVEVSGAVPEGAFVRLYRDPADGSVALGDDAGDGSAQVLVLPTLAGGRVEDWLAAVSVRAGARSTVAIDELQPGRYLACVETGEYEKTLRLGSAPVELAEGARVHVRVAVDAADAAIERAHLAGTVLPPPGADCGDWTLELRRRDGPAETLRIAVREMSTTRRDPHTRRWDAGLVPAGDWIATLRPIQHRQRIAASGEARIEIEVPAVGTLEVEVFDAASGAPLTPARLRWSGPALAGVDETDAAPLVYDPGTKRWRATAAAGELQVRCEVDGYRPRSQNVELRGGTALVRLAMER